MCIPTYRRIVSVKMVAQMVALAVEQKKDVVKSAILSVKIRSEITIQYLCMYCSTNTTVYVYTCTHVGVLSVSNHVRTEVPLQKRGEILW